MVTEKWCIMRTSERTLVNGGTVGGMDSDEHPLLMAIHMKASIDLTSAMDEESISGMMVVYSMGCSEKTSATAKESLSGQMVRYMKVNFVMDKGKDKVNTHSVMVGNMKALGKMEGTADMGYAIGKTVDVIKGTWSEMDQENIRCIMSHFLCSLQ